MNNNVDSLSLELSKARTANCKKFSDCLVKYGFLNTRDGNVAFNLSDSNSIKQAIAVNYYVLYCSSSIKKLYKKYASRFREKNSNELNEYIGFINDICEGNDLAADDFEDLSFIPTKKADFDRIVEHDSLETDNDRMVDLLLSSINPCIDNMEVDLKSQLCCELRDIALHYYQEQEDILKKHLAKDDSEPVENGDKVEIDIEAEKSDEGDEISSVLIKYKALLDKGLITAEDYNLKKNYLLTQMEQNCAEANSKSPSKKAVYYFDILQFAFPILFVIVSIIDFYYFALEYLVEAPEVMVYLLVIGLDLVGFAFARKAKKNGKGAHKYLSFFFYFADVVLLFILGAEGDMEPTAMFLASLACLSVAFANFFIKRG